MTEEGHEGVEIVDPDTLDDEAFEKERDKLLSEADDTAGESLEDGDTGQEETEEGEGEPDKKPAEEEEEVKPFTLEEEEPGESFLEIVHGGQTKSLTKEEAIRKAQMGEDYEHKMKMIAPHRRLIELVSQDQNLQKLIAQYVQSGGKVSLAEPEQPKLKPISDYTGDDAAERWLADGIKALTAPKPEKPNVTPQNEDVGLALQVRAILSISDPDNFDQVFPVMIQNLPTLSHRDINTINSQCADGDFRGIAKFYNYVRDNIVKPKAKPELKVIKTEKPEKFRAKPGGGKPPKESSADGDLPDAFSYSDEEFRKVVAKAKGHY